MRSSNNFRNYCSTWGWLQGLLLSLRYFIGLVM